MFRFDYFQTDSDVTLTILKRNVELASCRVAFSNNFITVYNGEEIIFEGELAGSVDQENITVKCTQAKVRFLIFLICCKILFILLDICFMKE